MNAQNTSNLFLKISGIIILIYTIINIPTYINYYISYADRSFSIFIISVVIPNILPLIIGIFLYNAPQKVTNKIVLNENEVTDGEDGQMHMALEQIALSVLGFYFLFSSVSDIFFHLANFLQGKANFSKNFRGEISYLIFLKNPTTISTMVEFVFSLWVIFKAKAISRYIVLSQSERQKPGRLG